MNYSDLTPRNLQPMVEVKQDANKNCPKQNMIDFIAEMKIKFFEFSEERIHFLREKAALRKDWEGKFGQVQRGEKKTEIME